MQDNNNRSRIWTGFALVALIILGAWLWRGAQANAQSGSWQLFAPTTANIVLDNIMLDPGETGTVEARLTTMPGEPVAAANFTVNYDPTVVTPTNGVPGDGAFGACNFIDNDGVNPDTIECNYANAQGTNGTDVLFYTFTFEAEPTNGVSPLNMVFAEFADNNGVQIDVSVADGSIVVGATPTPTPTNTPIPPTPTNTPIPPTPTPTSTPVPNEESDVYLPIVIG